MKIKDIIQNSFWFGIFPRLTSIANVVCLPFITPLLTQNDYGAWGIISACIGLISGFATLGLHINLANSYYEYKNNFALVWRRLFFWMYIGGLISFLVAFIILQIQLPETVKLNRIGILILACLPVLFSVNTVIAQHYYNLKLKPRPLVIRQTIGSLLGVITLFTAVYFFELGYIGYVLSSAVSSCAIFILFIKPIWLKAKIYPQYNKLNKRVISWVKLAIPVIPHNVGHILLGSSSRVIMALLAVPIADIGIYTNGFLTGEYASVLILALVTSLAPVIQTTYRRQDNRQMFKIFVFCEIITLSIVFALGSWMREIYIILIRNESLRISSEIASYTCFSMAMYPLYTLLMTVAAIEKKTTKILWLIFVPSIIGIKLNLILIPFYGYKAAIYVTLISYWSLSLISYFVPYYRSILELWFQRAHYIFVLPIICVVLLILAQVVNSLPLFYKSILTIILLLCLMIIAYIFKEKIRSFSLNHNDIASK